MSARRKNYDVYTRRAIKIAKMPMEEQEAYWRDRNRRTEIAADQTKRDVKITLPVVKFLSKPDEGE